MPSDKAASRIFLSSFFLFLVCLNIWAFGMLFQSKNSILAFLGDFQDNVAAANTEGVTSVGNVLSSGGDLKESSPPIQETAAKPKSITFDASSYFSSEFRQEGERVLFAKDEQKKFPIASLTKLMTALVVLKHYQLDEPVTVSELALNEEGDQGNLKEGEVLSVKNLLYITLIESSNRAAFALSEVLGPEVFVDQMNEEAEALGLSNTHFVDSTGLSPDSYSSAEDIAILSKYLFSNYPLFREIVGHKEFELYLDNGKLHHKLTNTNRFLGEIEGVIGGKTGWTTVARGCLMVFQQTLTPDNYRVNVILGAEDRFLEMEKLIDWLYSQSTIY